MDTCVYDKTDKGREEIATRKYHVPPRLRTLLVMIDGKRSADVLIGDLAAIGLTEHSFDQLLRDDYIRLIGSTPAPAPAPSALRPAGLEARAAAAPPAEPEDGAERFHSLYDFYSQTIKSSIGLRGIGLQLKVEKCSTVDEFRALRLAYLDAVLKTRGREMALSLRERLDVLLGGRPAGDPFDPS